MSCHLVSKSHIDAIVALCATERLRKGVPITRDEMATIGAMLIRANVRSVESRYPDTVGKPEEMPGPNFDTSERAHADRYTWAPVKNNVTPIAALSLLHCYEYQTNEFDGYEVSDAGLLCRYLQHWIVSRFFPGMDVDAPLSDFPGHNSAPWGI